MAEKIRQLLSVLDQCPGIIIVGDALTGKSSMLKVLASTLKFLQVKVFFFWGGGRKKERKKWVSDTYKRVFL